MHMRARTLTRANFEHKHKHTGLLFAMTVVPMDHRGIAALKDLLRRGGIIRCPKG